MGALNDFFSKDKNDFSKIEEILKIVLFRNKNKSNNIEILHEIGLLKEYSYIKSNKSSNELISYSPKNKLIKNFIDISKLKENFIQWVKILFDISQEDFDSVHNLNVKLENLKQNPLNKSFFSKNLKKYLFNDKSFNELLNYGIPNNFREFVWYFIFSEKYNNHKYFNYEEELKIYNLMLKNVKNNTQIEKDVYRTLREEDQIEKNLQKLKNILNCINIYNNGYCQGMNLIAGFLLKATNFDEVETFYIFKNILKDIKGYFESGFPLLRKNIYLFDLYFKKLYPKLYKHFKKYEIMNDYWVGKWFQSLFTIYFPFEELCYIWDILLIKGFDFIIYISLAIIDELEKELLKLNDTSDILEYLENVMNPKETISIRKIMIKDGKYNNIIQLNKIFLKASKIKENNNENNINKEKIIPKINIINKGHLQLKNTNKNNDTSSIKGSDKSISTKFSTSSRNSSNSFNHNSKLEFNKNRNNNKSSLYCLKKTPICNTFNMNYNTINMNNNNFFKYPKNLEQNNITIFYKNSYGFQSNKYAYLNNSIKYNTINITPQYGNYFIYYT